MLHFAQPLWLVAGTITCLAAALFILLNIVRRKKELQQFVSPHLLAALTRNVSMPRRRMKNILLVLGLVCLFVAGAAGSKSVKSVVTEKTVPRWQTLACYPDLRWNCFVPAGVVVADAWLRLMAALSVWMN